MSDTNTNASNTATAAAPEAAPAAPEAAPAATTAPAATAAPEAAPAAPAPAAPAAPTPIDECFGTIVGKSGEGATVALDAARKAALKLETHQLVELASHLKSTTVGAKNANLEAASELLKIARRQIELEDRAPFESPNLGGHGLYATATPNGTIGGEIGFVSDRDGRKAYSGIGIYLRCEHLEPHINTGNGAKY